jgi:hypothetical protein
MKVRRFNPSHFVRLEGGFIKSSKDHTGRIIRGLASNGWEKSRPTTMS